MKKITAVRARVPAVKARAARPRPLRRAFAVVATRLLGEYETREEADRAAVAYQARKDEWVVTLSNKEKAR